MLGFRRLPVALFAALGVLVSGAAARQATPEPAPTTTPAPATALPAAGKPTAAATSGASGAQPRYVGAVSCAPCHPRETALWRGSHHDLAMEPATPATVLGDFDDASLTADGVTTAFLRRDDAHLVRTEGPDSEPHEYRVEYTFGVTPLQQYLVALPGGRYQALRAAWDARPREEGGQRWFHLYPGERIAPDDVLHWTGPAQNWNHMCAECHSTNLVKGYDADAGSFATTWTDVDVACEACHGPGSRHVAWAEAARTATPATTASSSTEDAAPDRGLVVTLGDGSDASWKLADGAAIAHRTKPLASRVEVETCARCHSRRARIWDEYLHGEPLAQTHLVSLLEPGLYHADGQILEEVYVYGSFLSSRMHAAGVTCSDCHDPHSLALRASGNALCTRCHRASVYDADAHHHHGDGDAAAARCVSCHMSERLYMVIDGRRDHSFRVPRPDLSTKLGTPNACNDCHADESPAWAAEAIVRWRQEAGAPGAPRAHFGEVLHAGRASLPGTEDRLASLSRDRTKPGIVRASALSLLARSLSPRSLPALESALRDDEPLVRRAAVEASLATEPRLRARLVAPLLGDPIRTVRLAAVAALLDAQPRGLTDAQREDLARAVAEYRRVQELDLDRAEARANLAQLEAWLGNVDAARAGFSAATRLQPSFAPAWIGLAEVERRAGREQAAEAALRRGIAVVPEVAALHHALGLSLVRQRRVPDALPELAKAAELDPAEPRYAFVSAVALHDSGEPQRAIEVLAAAQTRHPGSREILAALVEYSGEVGERRAALAWARKLAAIDDDPGIERLIRALETQQP